MSLVETYQRRILEGRSRMAQAAVQYQMRKKTEELQKTAQAVARIIQFKRRPYDPADELAWRIEIEGFTPAYDKRVPTIAEIQAEACEHFGLQPVDFLSQRRTADLIRPRHITYYLCATLTTKSLPEIGKRLGGRDHTTILHGVRKVEKQKSGDIQMRASIEMLTARLGARDISDKRHVRVKLTAEIAAAIRASDEHSLTLAKKYGVTLSSINNIRAGRTWRPA